MSEVKENKLISPLVDKIIVVKPILRDSALFDKPIGMLKGTQMSIDLPIDPQRKSRINIFKNEEERIYLEERLSLPKGALSTFDRESKFWNGFIVILTEEELILNLANVTDFLKYRLLLANSDKIAPSWGERNDDGRYRFALVEKGFEDVEINSKNEIKKKAYIAFGKIEDSVDKMVDVLNVLGMKITNRSGISQDGLKAAINRIIEDPNPESVRMFVKVLGDKDFDYRVLLDKAIQVKALYRIGKNGYRLPKGEEPIADDTKEMIDWMKNPKNSLKVETIRAQIDQA